MIWPMTFPEQKCGKCGRFIPWSDAVLVVAGRMCVGYRHTGCAS